MRVLLENTVDSCERCGRVERRFAVWRTTSNPEAQGRAVLLVHQNVDAAEQDVDMLDDSTEGFDAAAFSAPASPKLFAKIQVEAHDRSSGPGSGHRLLDERA